MKSRTPSASQSLVRRSQPLIELSTHEHSLVPSLQSIKNKTCHTRTQSRPDLRSIPHLYNQSESDEVLGSEILSNLNFALNPQIYQLRRRRKTQNHKIMERLKDQAAENSVTNKRLEPLKEERERNSRQKSVPISRPKIRKPRSVSKGTISMLKTTEPSHIQNMKETLKEQKDQFIRADKSEKTQKTKENLRRSLINWLLSNKKEIVDKINENHQTIISWMVYLRQFDRREFQELLLAIGITYDASLFNRLFWLFDVDENNIIDQKEMLTVLDLFKENCFDEKLNMFFQLADDDARGYINEDKLVRLFKKNLRTEEELKAVKPAVKVMVEKELKLGDRKIITKEDISRACSKSETLKLVVEKNVKYLKKNISPILKVNASNFVISTPEVHQEGFSLPYMQRLIKAIEEKHELREKHSELVYKHSKALKYLQGSANGDE